MSTYKHNEEASEEILDVISDIRLDMELVAEALCEQSGDKLRARTEELALNILSQYGYKYNSDTNEFAIDDSIIASDIIPVMSDRVRLLADYFANDEWMQNDNKFAVENYEGLQIAYALNFMSSELGYNYSLDFRLERILMTTWYNFVDAYGVSKPENFLKPEDLVYSDQVYKIDEDIPSYKYIEIFKTTINTRIKVLSEFAKQFKFEEPYRTLIEMNSLAFGIAHLLNLGILELQEDYAEWIDGAWEEVLDILDIPDDNYLTVEALFE